MKNLINLENAGGIGVVGRNMIRYYSSTIEAGNLSIVSPSNIPFETRSENLSLTILPVQKKDISKLDKISLGEQYQREIRNLRRIIERESPDIISYSGTYTFPWLLLQASKKSDAKKVVTIDGIIELESSEPLRHEMGRDFINLRKFSYIFPSTLAKKTLESIHGVIFSKFLISPNGISPIFLNQPEKRQSDTRKAKIGFVGRFQPVKNPLYMIELSQQLKENGLPFEIFALSGSENNFTCEYKRNVAKKMESEGIVLLPPHGEEELAEFYRKMDLLIVPSLFETHANVTLESLACGTPVCVSKNVGSSEILKKMGLEQLIVDPKNFEEVLDRIKEVKKGDLRIEEEHKKYLKERFSWEEVFNRREKFRRS